MENCYSLDSCNHFDYCYLYYFQNSLIYIINKNLDYGMGYYMDYVDGLEERGIVDGHSHKGYEGYNDCKGYKDY